MTKSANKTNNDCLDIVIVFLLPNDEFFVYVDENGTVDADDGGLAQQASQNEKRLALACIITVLPMTATQSGHPAAPK